MSSLPSNDEIRAIAREFDGRHANVGLAFQALPPHLRIKAKTRAMLIISKNNLAKTPAWRFIRRERLKAYVQELQAIEDGRVVNKSV